MIKKYLIICLFLSICILVSCNNKNDIKDNISVDNDLIKEKLSEDGKVEIAFISDIGDIKDKSYNSGIWNGIQKYAEDKNKTYKHFKSGEKTDIASEESVELAVKSGAKIIVLGGPLFEKTLYKSKDKYKDVKFIGVDCVPDGDSDSKEVGKNVHTILFAEEQLGYLSGYSVVKEGYKNIGFMGGMALPAIRRFGIGFLQGIDDAARDLNLPKSDVRLKYTYLGNFEENSENESLASSWYSSGVEVIFVPAGGASKSIMKAAEALNKSVVGVDIDQSEESKSVITSAKKNLSYSVYKALDDYYNDKFEGNVIKSLGANENGISLELKNSRFKKFTEEEYKKIYDDIASKRIKVLDDKVVKEDGDVKFDNISISYEI